MDQELLNILSFSGGHLTNLVLVTSMALGACAGLVGSFIYLRGRTLISDASSHACLPGVAIGFFVALALGLDGGKHLPTLMAFSLLSGLVGTFCVDWIQKNTRLNDDVAIATVLSVFYGLGIVLLSIIQRIEGASQAGIDQVLLGQITGLTYSEMQLNITVSVTLITITALLARKFTLLCFDAEFANTIGHQVKQLDIALMLLMLSVVAVGLKTIGIILILALLIIPPVTARLITNRIKPMLALSMLIGLMSGYIGTSLSAYLPNLPSGGTIILSTTALFTLALIKHMIAQKVIDYA